MNYRGRMKNGVIVLDEPNELPDGTVVRVQVVPMPSAEVTNCTTGSAATLYEKFKPFIGCLDDMPADMSVNLDHYLYGAPKQNK